MDRVHALRPRNPDSIAYVMGEIHALNERPPITRNPSSQQSRLTHISTHTVDTVVNVEDGGYFCSAAPYKAMYRGITGCFRKPEAQNGQSSSSMAAALPPVPVVAPTS